MMKNYLKISIRNFNKNRLNTCINILSLSLAFVCCILSFSFIRSEYTYDKFHNNADNIFEMIAEPFYGDSSYQTGTQVPLGPTLTGQFPEINSAARIEKKEFTAKYGERVFKETFIGTDPDFFDIFNFPLNTGNSERLFSDINSVIISPQIADKYFGRKNPTGETLSIKLEEKFIDFNIVGILEKIPENSSLKPDFILNIKNMYPESLYEWDSFGGPAVFVLLNNKNQVKELESKFVSTINLRFSESGYLNKSRYLLFPFGEYHLNGNFSTVLSSKSKNIYSFVMLGIALLVFILAVCNFVNLSIGGSSPRLKEIGLRKVFGAKRKQLVRQFLLESVLISFIALFAGVLLSLMFLPSFNTISQKALELDYLLNWQYISGLLGMVILVGITAGSYPALILTRFPTSDLFQKLVKITGKNAFSRAIIVLQFTISIFFIISTLVIYKQHNFMLNENLGFDSKNVMVLSLDRDSSEPGRNKLILSELRNSLSNNNSIQSISASTSKYNQFSGTFLSTENEKNIFVGLNWIDYNYLDFFNIKLQEGRNFSKEFPSDQNGSIIINKTFAETFKIDSPVGKKLSSIFQKVRQDAEIVGVVDNLHHSSLHEEISPFYLSIQENESYNHIYIRLQSDNIQNSISFIKDELNLIAPDIPFLYSFIDEEMEGTYDNEKRYGQMFILISFFAIFIACSGLFGLTSLIVSHRTKEIGIRKVLGASIPNIMKLIHKEFFILVCIGNIIAWPCAYFISKSWLQNFAYRVNIGMDSFIIAGLIAFFISTLTISFQSNKAASTNPVDSLRSE
ncbi:ABC transporter permease [Acidobacteriota bacterium]